jgi:hypothetical protein
VGAVAPLNNRDQGGQEGADEATVELLIEGAQDGSKEGSQVTRESVGHKRGILRGEGRCGRMA